MKKLCCIITFSFSLLASYGQDSLYLASDAPVIKDGQTTAVTVGTQITVPSGSISAIKFWKNENGNSAYVITVWTTSGVSLFSTQYKSTTTGWQKVTLNLQVEPNTYIIGVYYPSGKYSYTNAWYPRTRGSLQGTTGLFASGNFQPAYALTAGFFVDVVFKKTEIVKKPLIVNAGPDSTYRLPNDSVVVLNGIVTGDSTYYEWVVVDSAGTCAVTNLQSLKPTIKTKESCTLIMLLVGHDKYGVQLASAVQVDILPDRKTIVAELYLDGTYKIIDRENFFLMNNRSQ